MAGKQGLPLDEDDWFNMTVQKRLETLVEIMSNFGENTRRSMQQVMDAIAALSTPLCRDLRPRLVRHVNSFLLTLKTDHETWIDYRFLDTYYWSSEADLNARWPLTGGYTRHTYRHLIDLFPDFISWLPEFDILSTPEELYVDYRAEDLHMDRPAVSPATIAALPRIPLTRALQGKNDKADCAICLQGIEGNTVTILPCEHFFHHICINTWLGQPHGAPDNTTSIRYGNCCPLCRKRIPRVVYNHGSGKYEGVPAVRLVSLTQSLAAIP